jgi:hypothetical protein
VLVFDRVDISVKYQSVGLLLAFNKQVYQYGGHIMLSVREKIYQLSQRNLAVEYTLSASYEMGALPTNREALLAKAELLKAQVNTLVLANATLVAAHAESEQDEDIHVDLHFENLVARDLQYQVKEFARQVIAANISFNSGVVKQYEELRLLIPNPILIAKFHGNNFFVSVADISLPQREPRRDLLRSQMRASQDSLAKVSAGLADGVKAKASSGNSQSTLVGPPSLFGRYSPTPVDIFAGSLASLAVHRQRELTQASAKTTALPQDSLANRMTRKIGCTVQ